MCVYTYTHNYPLTQKYIQNETPNNVLKCLGLCNCPIMCMNTINDIRQIYCWRSNSLQVSSLFRECCAAHSSGLPQKPLFPFMLLVASI